MQFKKNSLVLWRLYSFLEPFLLCRSLYQILSINCQRITLPSPPPPCVSRSCFLSFYPLIFFPFFFLSSFSLLFFLPPLVLWRRYIEERAVNKSGRYIVQKFFWTMEPFSQLISQIHDNKSISNPFLFHSVNKQDFQ